MSTFRTWLKCNRKIVTTSLKRPFYHFNNSNPVALSVDHTYQPDITEPNIVHYQEEQRNICFEVNHIDLYKDALTNNTICNVQTSQKFDPQAFPHLPFCAEIYNF